MTKKYTAADFANARFAEHPDGRLAHRINHPDGWAWAIESPDGVRDRVTDSYMSDGGDDCLPDPGWVPVPTKPTLTDSEVGELVPINLPEEYLTGFIDGFEEAGGTIIPGPEPTNTDRLEKLIISAPGNFEGVEAILKRPANVRAWAEYLNDHGVTAPNVKGN